MRYTSGEPVMVFSLSTTGSDGRYVQAGDRSRVPTACAPRPSGHAPAERARHDVTRARTATANLSLTRARRHDCVHSGRDGQRGEPLGQRADIRTASTNGGRSCHQDTSPWPTWTDTGRGNFSGCDRGGPTIARPGTRALRYQIHVVDNPGHHFVGRVHPAPMCAAGEHHASYGSPCTSNEAEGEGS